MCAEGRQSISPESDVAVGSTGGGLTILEPPSSDSDRPQHTTRHLSSPEPVSQMSGQEETGEEEEEVGGEVEKAVDEEEEERKREVDERVVDQVLSLFTKTPHISQYMDTHCKAPPSLSLSFRVPFPQSRSTFAAACPSSSSRPLPLFLSAASNGGALAQNSAVSLIGRQRLVGFLCWFLSHPAQVQTLRLMTPPRSHLNVST